MTDVATYLAQTTTYRTADRVYYVTELTADQLGEALALLNRFATGLHYAVHRDVDVTDDEARDWLADRPLYRRLLDEQRRRARARRLTLDEAMDKIDAEYGNALRELGDA